MPGIPARRAAVEAPGLRARVPGRWAVRCGRLAARRGGRARVPGGAAWSGGRAAGRQRPGAELGGRGPGAELGGKRPGAAGRQGAGCSARARPVGCLPRGLTARVGWRARRRGAGCWAGRRGSAGGRDGAGPAAGRDGAGPAGGRDGAGLAAGRTAQVRLAGATARVRLLDEAARAGRTGHTRLPRRSGRGAGSPFSGAPAALETAVALRRRANSAPGARFGHAKELLAPGRTVAGTARGEEPAPRRFSGRRARAASLCPCPWCYLCSPPRVAGVRGSPSPPRTGRRQAA
ncbi:hypothetical protein FHX34_10350 [Actinoplanes teichomyceticus]|uniref:Uncharacterized protein n=1 Tax=Actinoplanes teichomyceticus TaxID=1867 RepID=A0A561W9H5_ACTTI|nr:hypothetical protein FHX34_10350 [Actinoplanes teichomyceticus]